MNIDAEKQLWVSIQSKGILHTDVQELYRKARSAYENIILNDHEVVDHQDVEYSLWKLHYKHIDEFRKRMRSISGSAEGTKSETRRQDVSNVVNSVNSHMEGFKLFLSEATEFYRNLIRKFRSCHCLPEESCSFKKGSGGSFSVEPAILNKCHYVSHRFLVCLGDLARYRELCKKPDGQNRKWAAAATYYLEATMVWPDSGNPQNQLALLATYVGDDFLALYHCIRSLAVNEPFPDAWDNLMLLCEKNRSSQLHSLSCKAHFDWSKPSKRCSLPTKAHSSIDSLNGNGLEATEHVSNGKADLWPLFVKMISFFLTKSSLEDFPCTFASTMSELEALLELDDAKLKSSLEPYEQLDPARKGPYRALQLVSILVFVIHNLAEHAEVKHPKEKNASQLSDLMQLAWTCIFTFLGRFLERCLKGNSSECCPLLAAVLVSVEWLVGMLDKAVIYAGDEKVSSAKSYFLDTFIDFLNRLHGKEDEVKSPGNTALWEDYELRGFGPIAHLHDSLDFSTHWEHMSKYDGGNLIRASRILQAAMKIGETLNGTKNWISYDQLARKFYIENSSRATNENVREIPVENGVKGESSSTVEEEEVILFKPITRYNSAPMCTFGTIDLMSVEGTKDEAVPSDDLRRASSLFVTQNEAQLDPLNFRANFSNLGYNKPFKLQESLTKDTDTCPTGPPSLSAWVLNRDSLNIEREKGTINFNKHELPPIEEMPSASFTNLSIREAVDSPYVAPVPSAPLLPEDAVWFRGNSMGINEGHGILGAPPVSGFSNFPATHGPFDVGPGIPGFVDGYRPVLGMSSSEWLYHYKNNLHLERSNNHIRPGYTNVPGSPGTYSGQDVSRFDLFDRWGNPLASNRMVYMENPQLSSAPSLVNSADEQRKDKPVLGYQRPSPYGCGVGTDLRAEQPQLLQVLKEREWQLQRESLLRGPTYMGK